MDRFNRVILTDASMKYKYLLVILSLLLTTTMMAQKKTVYVDPMIGTNGMGHTFPGACVPHGLVQLSPDTDTVPHNIDGVYQPRAYEYCAGYQYRDKTIVGFNMNGKKQCRGIILSFWMITESRQN